MKRLEIRNLRVSFPSDRGAIHIIDGFDIDVQAGEVLGLVGESGSGKSVSMLALMGLLSSEAIITADVLRFETLDLLSLSPRKRRALTGADMAMIFQEPTASLNPCFTVGWQLEEALALGRIPNRRHRAAELLEQVGILNPAKRLRSYPHELSGGMNQRVMIAMAIARNPRLLIADEPTTALDVTVQQQILELLRGLQKNSDMSLVLITHDLGVLARIAQRVAVMYAGQAVEVAATRPLFTEPQHPYTKALLDALPEHSFGRHRLLTIPGVVPALDRRPPGCNFAPRCDFAGDKCRSKQPELDPVADGRGVRCHYPNSERQTMQEVTA
jgi:dipeptide transport system ATP-binding protein